MNQKTCPACGEVIDSGAARCPRCGLEGLNQIFLSHGDYELWRKKVLEPHMGRLQRRLFASESSLLILTQGGQLYGILDNDCGQLLEDGPDIIQEPVLMASGVVSAAVSRRYSIFATQDGRVHIRGRGEFADRVPAFSDAKEVFVRESTFHVVNEKGTVLGFGENNGLEPRKQEVLCTTEPLSTETGPFYQHWGNETRFPSDSDWEEAKRCFRSMVQRSTDYEKFAARYGEDNLKIEMDISSREIYKTHSDQGTDWWLHFDGSPRIVFENNVIYTPVVCADQYYADTPHRIWSEPLYPDTNAQLEAHPQIKKACKYYRYREPDQYIALCHDGALAWIDKDNVLNRLDWPKAPIYDLAVLHAHTCAISCQDSRVYMVDTQALPAVRILCEIKLP